MPYVHIKTMRERKAICHLCKNYKKETNSCLIDNQSINLKSYIGNCQENKWPAEVYIEEPTPKSKKNRKEPSIVQKAASLFNSLRKWIVSGLLKTSKRQLAFRMATCKGCEFWDRAAWGGTGKCTKCGCSTWAKLRMKTERCPIGKW
jgi:hypothetical protein